MSILEGVRAMGKNKTWPETGKPAAIFQEGNDVNEIKRPIENICPVVLT